MYAEYVSPSSFRVSGNETANFVKNRRVKLGCGVDGNVIGTITSSEYDGTYTVVVIVEGDITSNLETAFYSVVLPGMAGNLPNHKHSSDEGEGGALSFTTLSDTPTTYSGTEGQLAVSTGSGVVFRAKDGVAMSFLDLNDTPLEYPGATTGSSVTITIPASVVDEDLVNFPVLLNLGSSVGIDSFDISTIFDALGYSFRKLRVLAADNTPLYVEVESWLPLVKHAALHVKVPLVSSSEDTILILKWGSNWEDDVEYIGLTGEGPARNVWDSDFINVYNMNQDPTGGAGCILDSTTTSGNCTPNGSMTSGDLVDGSYGKGLELDGVDDFLGRSSNNLIDNHTSEVYIMPNDTQRVYSETTAGTTAVSYSSENKHILQTNHHSGDENCGVGLMVGTNAAVCVLHGDAFYPTPIVVEDDYSGSNYFALQISSNVISLYVNETLVDTYDPNRNVYSPVHIGYDSYGLFSGTVYTVRISSVVRSDAWLKATSKSLSDNLVILSDLITPLTGEVVVRMNSTQDGLEFYELANLGLDGTFIGLLDTPTTYSGTGGQFIKSTGSGVVWTALSNVTTLEGAPDASTAGEENSYIIDSANSDIYQRASDIVFTRHTTTDGLLYDRYLGSSNEGAAGFTVYGTTVLAEDHYVFDGGGVLLGGDLTEPFDIYAKVLITSKALGTAQIIWTTGGSGSGMAVGLSAAGDLVFSTFNTGTQTSISIDSSYIEQDTVYYIYAAYGIGSLYLFADGGLVANVSGTLSTGDGGNYEQIGGVRGTTNYTSSALTGTTYGDLAEGFVGNVYEVELFTSGSFTTTMFDTLTAGVTSWQKVLSTTKNFLELLDTPSTYSGTAGNVLRSDGTSAVWQANHAFVGPNLNDYDPGPELYFLNTLDNTLYYTTSTFSIDGEGDAIDVSGWTASWISPSSGGNTANMFDSSSSTYSSGSGGVGGSGYIVDIDVTLDQIKYIYTLHLRWYNNTSSTYTLTVSAKKLITDSWTTLYSAARATSGQYVTLDIPVYSLIDFEVGYINIYMDGPGAMSVVYVSDIDATEAIGQTTYHWTEYFKFAESTDLSTLSGTLQSQIDAASQTFLDLDDTPTTYSGTEGQLMVSTGSGVELQPPPPALYDSTEPPTGLDGKLIGDYNLDVSSNTLYKRYREYTSGVFQAKSIVLDIADNWGDSNYVCLREMALYYQGAELSLTSSDFTAYATSNGGTSYTPNKAFDTTLALTGGSNGYEWLATSTTNQRLIVVFNAVQTFTSIVVNNSHNVGSSTTRGSKNVKIYITLSEITDTTYGASVDGAYTIFDGQFTEHVASDVEDPETLTLEDPAVDTGWDVLLAFPSAFVDLSDTPSTYSGTEGYYLKSTGSGTVWAGIETTKTFFSGDGPPVDEVLGSRGFRTSLIPTDGGAATIETASYSEELVNKDYLSDATYDGATTVFDFADTRSYGIELTAEQYIDTVYIYDQGSDFPAGYYPSSSEATIYAYTSSDGTNWTKSGSLYIANNYDQSTSYKDISGYARLTISLDEPVLAKYVAVSCVNGFDYIRPWSGSWWTYWRFSEIEVALLDSIGVNGDEYRDNLTGNLWEKADDIWSVVYESVNSFLDLDDTPSTYSNTAGYFLQSTGSGSSWTPLSVDKGMSELTDYNFGSNTISGTGDIHCTDLYTASNSIYIGDTKLSTTSGTLLVDGYQIESVAILTKGREPTEDDQGDFFIDSANNKIYGQIPMDGGVLQAKTIVLDIADNWGDGSYISLRSLELWYDGEMIALTTSDFTAYQLSYLGTGHEASKVFDTTLTKLGGGDGYSWTSTSVTNQRILCVFNSIQTFDAVVINNAHWSGSLTTRGVENVKMYITEESYTSTTYNSTVTNGTLIFDGIFPQHEAANVIDDYTVPITVPEPTVYEWGKILETGDATSDDLATLSGTLQDNIDNIPNEFIVLDDTPLTYSGTEGQLLVSTGSGVGFSTPPAEVFYYEEAPTGFEVVNIGDFGIVYSENSIYLKARDYTDQAIQAKSIIIDIADNFGSTSLLGIRAVDFVLGGATITNVATTNFTAYATTYYSTSYLPEFTFDTSLSKTGTYISTQWLAQGTVVEDQRLICVFNDTTTFDSIVINNSHNSGAGLDYGANNIKIYASTDEIVDTTYAATISNATLLFDGQLTAHVASDVEDPQELSLLASPNADSGWDPVLVSPTAEDLTNISGSLQAQIDAAPQTFLDLDDTPTTYSGGQYLRTTTSGIEAIDGIILRAQNESEWLIKVTNSGTLYTVEV